MQEMDRLKTSNDDAAVSYELTGGIGKSKATVDGKKSAISAFSKFLKSMLLPDYANMCAEIKGNVRNIGDLCDPTVFQKFATYLITFFLTKTNGTAKLGTILQYISGVVNQVYSDFPSNSTMIQSAIVGSWHTKLRDATTYDVTTIRALERSQRETARLLESSHTETTRFLNILISAKIGPSSAA